MKGGDEHDVGGFGTHPERSGSLGRVVRDEEEEVESGWQDAANLVLQGVGELGKCSETLPEISLDWTEILSEGTHEVSETSG